MNLMAESYQKKIMAFLYKALIVLLVRVLLPGNFPEEERKKWQSKKCD